MEDVIDVMKSHLAVKDLTVRSCHDIAPGFFQFNFTYRTKRMMSVHNNYDTPLGRMLLLSLGHNAEAIEIMRGIAKVLGGLLEESDCDDKMQMITGSITDEDKLQYHLKYAIINDGIDPDDIEGLRASIIKWDEKHKR